MTSGVGKPAGADWFRLALLGACRPFPLKIYMRWQTASALLRTTVYLRRLMPRNTLARDSHGYLELTARGEKVDQVEVANAVTVL